MTEKPGTNWMATPQGVLVALLALEIGIFAAIGKNFFSLGNAFEVVRLSVELGLIADENDRQVGFGGEGQPRAADVRGRAVIAAHRVEGDPHGSLPLLLFRRFHRQRVAPLVVAAVRTDAVRHHRLAAPHAELNLHRDDVVVAAPRALLGTGGAPFGYGHDGSRGRVGA